MKKFLAFCTIAILLLSCNFTTANACERDIGSTALISLKVYAPDQPADLQLVSYIIDMPFAGTVPELEVAISSLIISDLGSAIWHPPPAEVSTWQLTLSNLSDICLDDPVNSNVYKVMMMTTEYCSTCYICPREGTN